MKKKPSTGVEYGNRTIFELHSVSFLRTPGRKGIMGNLYLI